MILVFGKSGQVATELGVFEDVMCLGRDDADLSNPAACAAAILAHRPAAVINAAAYTNVDKAEEEEALATIVNGQTPGVMAGTCAKLDIPFVTISTDYVFNGLGSKPWRESDTTAPLGAYGRSKRAGEKAVENAGNTFAILRTSWVVSAHGNNFVKTMLRLGATRESLTVVSDQIGSPTPAADIARACVTIAKALTERPEASGIYHFSGAPDTSWAEFARAIFEDAGLGCTVSDIPTKDYPTPAARPLNSRMDCSRIETTFAIKRPDWRASLGQILNDLKQA